MHETKIEKTQNQ